MSLALMMRAEDGIIIGMISEMMGMRADIMRTADLQNEFILNI